MKLDVGGGHEKREGYISLDVNPHKSADVCGDALDMPVRSGSVTEISCRAFIDHLDGPRFGTKSVFTFLGEAYRVLEPGGVVDVEVGDLAGTCIKILEGDLSHLQNLYGAQRNEWDYHKWGYTKASLSGLLRDAGFVDPEVVTPRSSHATRWEMMRVRAYKPMDLREQAVKNLKEFRHVMEVYLIPFCLQDGTLLGAYRDGDFRPDDLDDCDVAVTHAHFREFVKGALPRLVELGFQVRKKFVHNSRIENVSIGRGGNHIDIACVHIVNDSAYNLARGPDGMFVYKFPAKHLSRFDTINFLGEDFYIPSDVEEYLAIRYTDWRTPVARADFNYLDPAQNPCLQTEWEECEQCKATVT